ncbi:hypothetical protein [Nocardioides sp. Iso805N]|uniref:hypothetical protein n=1 Tax=Nocardioides sp. Iso805N TaxID=1283287 RepID=UPI0003687160|nr:hypothetical protein [Nocardioides sp. Iso805N]
MATAATDFEPPEFHPRRPGLVRPVSIDPAGQLGPTRGQTMSGAWRRTGHGLYLPAHIDGGGLDQRLVEIGTALPAQSALTGWAALHWLGAPWTEGTAGDGSRLPVPILVPNHRTRSRPGVLITAERFRPGWIHDVDGLPITAALASVCFEARHAPSLEQAVRWLDIALAADLVSLETLAAYAPLLTAWTGVQQLRDAMALACENSWSPMETEMRLLWVLRLQRHSVVANHPVFVDGRFIGTPDLLDVEAGVVGEYDGALHLEGQRRAMDIRREGIFRRVGLEYVMMTSADRRDPSDFLLRARDAIARAARQPGPRRWTIDPPPRWIATTTVAARLALSAEQRARLLRAG